MKPEDVERIAAEHAERLGVAPFVLDGSEFDGGETPPLWRVYFRFRERPDPLLSLPDFFTVRVDDATGEASSVARL